MTLPAGTRTYWQGQDYISNGAGQLTPVNGGPSIPDYTNSGNSPVSGYTQPMGPTTPATTPVTTPATGNYQVYPTDVMNSMYPYTALGPTLASAMAQQQYSSDAMVRASAGDNAASIAAANIAAGAAKASSQAQLAGSVYSSQAGIYQTNAQKQADLVAAAAGDINAANRLYADHKMQAQVQNAENQKWIASNLGSGDLFDNVAGRIAMRGGGPLPTMGGALSMAGGLNTITADPVSALSIPDVLKYWQPAKIPAAPSVNFGSTGGGGYSPSSGGGGGGSISSIFSGLGGMGTGNVFGTTPVAPVTTAPVATPSKWTHTNNPTTWESGIVGMAGGGKPKMGATLVGEGRNFEGLNMGTAEVLVKRPGKPDEVIPIMGRRAGGGYVSPDPIQGYGTGGSSGTTGVSGTSSSAGAYQPGGVASRTTSITRGTYMGGRPTRSWQQRPGFNINPIATQPVGDTTTMGGSTSPSLDIKFDASGNPSIKVGESSNGLPTGATQANPNGALADMNSLPVLQQLRSGTNLPSIYRLPPLDTPETRALGIEGMRDPFQAASTYAKLPYFEQLQAQKAYKSFFGIDPAEVDWMTNQARPGFRNFGRRELQF